MFQRTRIKLIKAFEKFLYALNVLSYSALYVAFEIHRHNGVVNAQSQKEKAVFGGNSYALAVVVGNFVIGAGFRVLLKLAYNPLSVSLKVGV